MGILKQLVTRRGEQNYIYVRSNEKNIVSYSIMNRFFKMNNKLLIIKNGKQISIVLKYTNLFNIFRKPFHPNFFKDAISGYLYLLSCSGCCHLNLLLSVL